MPKLIDIIFRAPLRFLVLVLFFLLKGQSILASIIQTQDHTLCGNGGTMTIYAVAMDPTNDPNVKVRWYHDAGYTNLAGTGTDLGPPYPGSTYRLFSFEVTLTASKTYYLVLYHPGTNTEVYPEPAITSTVNVNSSVIGVLGTTLCGTGSATLVASGAPAGSVYTWYDADQITVLGNSSTFETPPLGGNGVYYVFASNFSCQKQRVDVIVDETYSNYVGTFKIRPFVSCINDNVLLDPEGAPPNALFFWFRSDGTVATSPSSSPFSPVITEPTTYSVSFFVNGCLSPRVSIPISPIDPPAGPDEQFTKCAVENIEITPSNETQSFLWHNAAGEKIAVGRTLRVAYRDALTPETFQVSSIDENGCVSSSRATITLNRTADCDDKVNWLEVSSYDESENLAAQSRSYFDLTGKPLQSQSKFLEDSLIFATQTINDQYDRTAITVLPAPTSKQYFSYDHFFVRVSSEQVYNYKAFDLPSNRLNPSPVHSTTAGTQGHYFSSNNDLETNVPASSFPFSQRSFYQDGSGDEKFSTIPGDQHRMGTGHEVLIGNFPVVNELTNYLEIKELIVPGFVAEGAVLNSVQIVSRDQNGRYSVVISDADGKTLVTGSVAGNLTQGELDALGSVNATNEVQVSAGGTSEEPKTSYFYILRSQNIQLNVTEGCQFTLEDVLNNTTVPSPSAAELAPGFYRFVVSEGTLTFSYQNNFYNLSYHYYDDVGRTKCVITPNGIFQLGNGNSIEEVDRILYTYNHQGWLLGTTETDAGNSSYLYRSDGRIRFSQNALQAEQVSSNGLGKFSFTNYDQLGRPIWSGEYIGNTHSFSQLESQLELPDQLNFPDSVMKDWIRTFYDEPDLTFGDSTNLQLVQRHVRGVVSKTTNKNNTSWYSYDEEGRVEWMAQKPTLLNLVFLTEYTYDYFGNVTTVRNTSHKSGTTINEFFHHYEYDKDQRLKKASTSVNGVDKELRATYDYYLHGPLKRVVLGNDLQGIDFVYNIHGWLTQINHPDNLKDPGGDGNDVFGMILDYYESDLGSVPDPGVQTGSIEDRFRPKVPSPNGIHDIHGLPVLASSISSGSANGSPSIPFGARQKFLNQTDTDQSSSN